MDNAVQAIALQAQEQRVQGLQARLQKLREDERLFQRAAGLKTQKEKDSAAIAGLREDLAKEKEKLAQHKASKALAISATASALAQKMGQVLPFGEAIFNIGEDGEVYLGLNLPDRGPVAYGGLSGGQRVLFDSALAYALLQPGKKRAVILVEGAELGGEIGMVLESVATSNVDAQIIACTCHEIGAVPDGWDMSRIGENGEVLPEVAANAF